MVDLSTIPNGGIPAGLLKRAYDEDAIAGATGGHAAGVLFIAPDGDVLVLRRSPEEENFGGHWGLPGGGVDDGESPEDGALRECREEMGIDLAEAGPDHLRDLDKVVTPTGKVFHTFAMPVPKKFAPRLNDEHTGYAWASLDMLPRPLHPAVEKTLKERLGEDFALAADGLLGWASTPKQLEIVGATDSALALALDRDSVREKDRDGRLRVSMTNISKANVCPYRGSEIPGWQKLGLDGDKIYNLLRDPDELKKAAPSLNGVPLLRKHVPVNADDHQPHEVVGSLGTDADFDGTYLKNSLFVNARDAIEGIETQKKRELSAGYHYTPDMTPGIFDGKAFDGIMRDIVFNHVALVEDGRAGPDVVVGDSTENLKMKSTRFAVAVLAATAAHIAPALAMDSKLKLSTSDFAKLTPKNLKDMKSGLLSTVRSAVDGKLRKGLALDATMAGLAKAIDAFEELDKPADDDLDDDVEISPADVAAAAEGAAPGGYDPEAIRAFLREKGLGEDDVTKVCDMMPKGIAAAKDSDEETEEEKRAREEKEKQAKDKNEQAMDAAIKSAVAAERKNQNAIRAALSGVEPWVGKIPPTMAFDSAPDVYRHALVMKGVDGAKTLHDDALRSVLEAQPKAGARPPEGASNTHIAMDSSALAKAQKMAPGLENITSV